MSQWIDIPGVTAGPDGQPRLPCRPEVVARTLKLAFLADGDEEPAIAAAVAAETGEDPVRVHGLLGWLPMSRVAAWNPVDGRLWLDPSTDVVDLAVRYAAWVGSQPIPANHVEQVKQYSRSVVEEAVRAAAGTARRGASQSKPVVAAAEAAPEPPLVSADLQRRVRALLAALDAAFLERRRHARLSLLALLGGQHVLLLGPPGTGKSLLARALCACFADGEGESRYFEYLLSKFTHPDELFGPVSIPGLKAEDYRRLTEGFLPTAHVAFLDEVFKANSAILNSLLTLVNERVFHHGRHRDNVPLVGLVGASNELPDPDGGLAALYDRFLVRLAVPPIADEDGFLRMATGQLDAFAPPPDARLRLAELREIRVASETVSVPPEVASALASLWRRSQAQEWGVSDRRWRQAVSLLKVAAATDGRRALQLLDLLLLDGILAPEPDRGAEIRDGVLEHLGARTVPAHDLRAQWTLLHADRVAPAPGEPPPSPTPTRKYAWPERLARRQASVRRLVVHHGEAVAHLAADRERLEASGERHLWLDRLPVQLLTAHIEAARDLARILEAIEAYAASVADPARAAVALLSALQQGSRRMYGSDAVCTLHVVDSATYVGVALSGEAVVLPAPPESARTGPDAARAGGTPPYGAIVSVPATRLLDWVDGAVTTEALAAKIPAWAGRQAATALESARRLLGNDAVPRPPELPAPSG